MQYSIAAGVRRGSVTIPSSKSQAHRFLICAALGEQETVVTCDGISKDIAATMACLNALGADCRLRDDGTIAVRPIKALPTGECRLSCGESGSTLRFLLPIAGALGVRVCFAREGRLPQRPLHPLDEELRRHGMRIWEEDSLLYCEGKLHGGAWSLPGNISSQYISGLLMALPLLAEDSMLQVTGQIESAAYIDMTEDALEQSNIAFSKENNGYRIHGGQRFRPPEQWQVEGDYSQAAFFLCMGAFSPDGISVYGLSPTSRQGDRAIVDILRHFGAVVEQKETYVTVRQGSLRAQKINAAPIPDLVPVLSVVAAVADGRTEITGAARLRLKESDRLHGSAELLTTLGASAVELPEGLHIDGMPQLRGGAVEVYGDHRFAMAAAVAACVCKTGVTVSDMHCVEKSYPRFWQDLKRLEVLRI